MWFTDELARNLSLVNSGQIVWTAEYTNYGKTPAHRVVITAHFFVDGKECAAPRPPASVAANLAKISAPVVPNKKDIFSVVSCPGIDANRWAALLDHDFGIKIKGTMSYRDAYDSRYETRYCLTRLRSGAIMYCDNANDIR